MNLTEQKKAVLALFDEAAAWGVPALTAKHMPRIAAALGIGAVEMDVVRRVPEHQVLEVRATPLHEGVSVIRDAQPDVPEEWKETSYGRLPVCRLFPAKTCALLNVQCEVFCRTHNVERCAFVLPEGSAGRFNAKAMARANSAHKQGYFVSEKHFVFGLRQTRHFNKRRPTLKLKGEHYV